MVIHRTGLFRLDGTGFSCSTVMQPMGGPVIPPPAAAYAGAGPVAGGTGPNHTPNVYVVPLDDQPEHWLRLMGEARLVMPGVGDPSRARHSGGVRHPDHAHVRLGGSISWAGPPHPHVRAHMDWLRGLSDEQLILHLAGSGAFDLPGGTS
jgi:hypothetical protein